MIAQLEKHASEESHAQVKILDRLQLKSLHRHLRQIQHLMSNCIANVRLTMENLLKRVGQLLNVTMQTLVQAIRLALKM